MKVALSTTGQRVDGHFGHCDYFTVYTVNKEEKKILSEEKIEAPKGCGCSSNIASVLGEHNIQVLLTNNLGGSILQRLENENIDVVLGCTGMVADVAQDWLYDRIIRNPFVCLDHK